MTSYPLHDLKWDEFQNLANTVIEHKYQIPVKSFRPLGRDGGRDGAATTFDNKECVVQAKHTSKPNAVLTMNTLKKLFIKEESEKIKRLIGNGLCHKYYAVTNYSVTAEQNERYKIEVKKLGVEVADLIGKEDLSRWIPGMPPKLLKNFASLYSDENELFSESLKETYKESSKSLRFQLTESFTTAKTNLQNNCKSFVFLLGEEKSGKTSMMEQLALISGNEKGILVPALHSNDFKDNAFMESSIFMVDDIFGKLEIDIKETEMWDKVFESNTISWSLYRKHNKIIMTSRNQIYEKIKNKISKKFRKFLEDNRIDVS